MQLQLLGTGAAEGFPGLFCRCETCISARTKGGKNIRTRASALVDGTIKIDFPPDIFHQIVTQNVDLCALKALLFTHEHDDHFSGAQLQYLGSYFVTEPRAEPLHVYGPPEVTSWLQLHLNLDRLPIAIHTLQAFEPISVQGYQILPIRAQHDPTTTCFNYLISDSKGATLLYATDTGWYEEDTWTILERYSIDGVVCECQKGYTEEGYRGHLSVPEVLRMRDRLIRAGAFDYNGPMAVTHLSHMAGLSHEEWESRLSPQQILTGYDGMMLEVERSH